VIDHGFYVELAFDDLMARYGLSTPEQNCIGWPEQKCITGYEAAEEVLSGTDGGLFGRAERSSPIAA
jgi:hypothetical protein